METLSFYTLCTTNDDHTMYGSWDMKHDIPYDVWFLRYDAWQNIFVILQNFLPFYPTDNPKNQNFEYHHLHVIKFWISSFHTSVLKIMIICYTVPEIWHMADVIFVFHLLPFYPTPSPLTAQTINLYKTEIESLEISSCVPKIIIRWCMVTEIWCTKDRQTDKRTERVTYRGGCPT